MVFDILRFENYRKRKFKLCWSRCVRTSRAVHELAEHIDRLYRLIQAEVYYKLCYSKIGSRYAIRVENRKSSFPENFAWDSFKLQLETYLRYRSCSITGRLSDD